MSTFNYGRTRDTADRLITKFGRQATLRRQTKGNGPAYNPGQGQPIDLTIRCVVLDYNRREVDGTMIQRTDKRVLVSAKGLDIQPEPSTDQIIIDDIPYTIVPPVSVLKPGEIVVMYECQCRR